MDSKYRIVQQSVGMRLGMIDQLAEYAHQQGHSLSQVVREAVDIHLHVTVPLLTEIAGDREESLEDTIKVAVEVYLTSGTEPYIEPIPDL